MIIFDFTEPELDLFRNKCNFVNYEKDLFEMRARGIPLEQIAEELDISSDYARKLSQKANKKILKIL